MEIRTKRIYDDAAPEDGFRVLVDRLWPRGISREQARLDTWAKDLAPSDELRKWFHDHSGDWGEFRNRYMEQLAGMHDRARELLDSVEGDTMTLLYAKKEREQNNAVVLRDYLRSLLQ